MPSPIENIIGRLRIAEKSLKQDRGSLPHIRNDLAGLIPKAAVREIIIISSEKIGDNVLLLPLVMDLQRQFGKAHLHIGGYVSQFRIFEGLLTAQPESGEQPWEEGFRLEIARTMRSLSFKEDEINLKLFRKKSEGFDYMDFPEFPWFLFKDTAPLNEFPIVEFPAEAEWMRERYGTLFGPGKVNVAFYVGSADYEDKRPAPYPRYWGSERFARLGSLLAGKFGSDLNLFILSGRTDAEEKVVDETVKLMDKDCKAKVVPEPTSIGFKRMCALFRSMDLVIGNDTGPIHLSYLSGAKTLVLTGLGAGAFGNFIPPLRNVKTISPNAPFMINDDRIKPERVFAAAIRFLNH